MFQGFRSRLAGKSPLETERDQLMAQCAAVGRELAAARAREAELTEALSGSRAALSEFQAWFAGHAETQTDRPDLEFSIGDTGPALERLRQSGCIVLRSDADMRGRIAAFRQFVNDTGHSRRKIPWGGGLWQVQIPGSGVIRLPLHETVRERLYPFCRAFLGLDVMMSTAGDTATIRTVNASKGLVKWHQDISPVDLTRCLTFWFAVSPDGIGRNAPGLKFVVRKQGLTDSKTAHLTDATGYHEIKTLQMGLGDVYWTPEMNPGDIAVFDAYCVHSSFSTPDMAEPRTSVDLRFAPFDARRGNSIIAARQGLVLMDRDGLYGPTRLVSERPVEFEYGSIAGRSEALPAAFREAQETAWVG